MAATMPLTGLKVADFSMGVAGPHAGMLLAENGADVVKVEPPQGDWVRTLGTAFGDLSAHAVAFHRGKRSIGLDMKKPGGREIAQKLAGSADVVLESFRPGVMDRFGLGYEQVRTTNPNVIYLSVTGFGQTGPNCKLPATDAIAQARSGLMHLNRTIDGLPQRSELIVIDIATGLYAYQAVASALIRRLRFNEGAYIDCSLMQSAFALQSAKMLEEYLEGSERPIIYSPLGVLKTADGYTTISVMRDEHFDQLARAIHREDLLSSSKFSSRSARIANDAELMQILREIFLTRTTTEWSRLLTEADVLHAPVRSYLECLLDKESHANAFHWMNQSGFDCPLPLPIVPGAHGAQQAAIACPHIGEHSREILMELGVTAAACDLLAASGTVSQSNGLVPLHGKRVQANG